LSENRRMKILFVDSPQHRYGSFRDIFIADKDQAASAAAYTYEFSLTENATQALELYKNEHPDLVMVNMSLGADVSKYLCETVRKLEGKRHTGIILLDVEGAHGDSTPIECLEIGADDVIRANCPLREIRARTHAVLRLKAMTDELRSANHKLHRLSQTDELTGLDNMRAFNAKYSRAVKECREGRAGLGIIMIDLDNFKMVNDKTNHLMGSHVISEVGKLVRSSGVFDAKKDCTARYGGDEYIFFTADTDFKKLTQKGEELRRLIRTATFVKDGFTIRITTSVGIAWVAPGFVFQRAEDPIKAADMMLYRSKRDGRDRVSSMPFKESMDIDRLSEDLEDEENPYRESGIAKIISM